MLQLEFTVEPFVEGHPGPHVTAAVAAAERAGGTVEFGPFGSVCGASDDEMPTVIAELVRAAFANGASHVTIHVAGARPDAGFR
ncbi:MAG: hypothetical protein ABIR32_17835 [Ilumatobacteraceae bacterium]